VLSAHIKAVSSPALAQLDELCGSAVTLDQAQVTEVETYLNKFIGALMRKAGMETAGMAPITLESLLRASSRK